MQENNNIGRVLHIDEFRVSHARSYLQNTLFPKFKKLIEEYNNLRILPPFTEKIWKEIGESEGRSVGAQYKKNCEREVSKIPAIAEGQIEAISGALRPFYSTYDALASSLDDNRPLGISHTLESLTIDKEGKPGFDDSVICEMFTTRIRTTKQQDFFNLAQTFIETANEIANFLDGTSAHPSRVCWTDEGGQGALFEVAKDGSMTLNPNIFRVI